MIGCGPLAIAHRGASDHATENTISAFRLAADLASEMWELDVRLTADGVCVVVHDDDLTRVAGIDLKISASDRREASKIRLPDDERIPRLQEVIAVARETGCGLYIEAKSQSAAFEAWRILREAKFRFAAIGSFATSCLKALRQAGCDYPLVSFVPSLADPFAHIGDSRPDIIHLCWLGASDTPHDLVTDELVARLQRGGFQIVTWHEDRPSVIEALMQKPIAGICSNRPELLKPYRCDPTGSIDIVCHRGANLLAPENTLEAGRICIDQGFQFVEIDLRTTADGELVAMHDHDLDRTTSGSGLVSDHSLADIQQLDAGSWFNERSAGIRVPTLGQFLEMAKGKCGVYVEIKHADPTKILEVVKTHAMLEECFFWSSDTDALRWLRQRSSEIALMAPRRMYGSLLVAVADYGAQIVQFDADLDDLTEVPQCRDLGVRSMVYSLSHDWHDLERCLASDPDLVNLDRPDRFKILVSYPEVRQHFLAATTQYSS